MPSRSVRPFTARFGPESEVNRLFMHRKRGDTITLEIAAGLATKPRTVVLTQGLVVPRSFPRNLSHYP
jgi:hypothetical protein